MGSFAYLKLIQKPCAYVSSELLPLAEPSQQFRKTYMKHALCLKSGFQFLYAGSTYSPPFTHTAVQRDPYQMAAESHVIYGREMKW